MTEEQDNAHTHTHVQFACTDVRTHSEIHTYLMVQSHDLQSLLSLSPHFVPRSRNQPQELGRWSCACVYVCACVCVCLCENMHTSVHECVGVFVSVKMPEMKISPAAELLTLVHALCSHAHNAHNTNTHTCLY